MDDLIIGDNQQIDLSPGIHKFAMLQFGKTLLYVSLQQYLF